MLNSPLNLKAGYVQACITRLLSKADLGTHFLHFLNAQLMTTIRAPVGHFTVLYFASASSYTNKPSGGHDFLRAPMLAAKLFETLEEMYPGMQEKVLSSCMLNVDDEYVDLEDEAQKGEAGIIIREGSTAVIVPPVSAG